MVDAAKKSDKGNAAQVQDAIVAFEQILEAMPNDRVALEMLYEAYEQAGNKERALEYVIRLGNTIFEENDADAAVTIVEKLRLYGKGQAPAEDLVKRLQTLVAPRKKVVERKVEAKRKTVDIANELSLAWNLLQAGELNQEEYSSVVHDLSENSTKNIEVPVTVLHVLQDRGFKNLERTLGFLVRDSGLPLVPLASFEIADAMQSALPIEFLKHRGAIPFEVMGKDLLIAVLNPYDTQLREEAEKAAGRRCHFYLATAQDYDAVLQKLIKAYNAAKAAS